MRNQNLCGSSNEIDGFKTLTGGLPLSNYLIEAIEQISCLASIHDQRNSN